MRLPSKLRGLKSTSGNAAVEFVIIAPLLVLLLGGIVEIGLAIRSSFALQNAVLTGANVASHKGWDSTAIRTAMTNSSPRVASATITVTRSCGCPSGTSIAVIAECDTEPLNPGSCPAACTTICPSDQLLSRQYAMLTASLPRQTVFGRTYGLPATLSASMTTQLR